MRRSFSITGVPTCCTLAKGPVLLRLGLAGLGLRLGSVGLGFVGLWLVGLGLRFRPSEQQTFGIVDHNAYKDVE